MLVDKFIAFFRVIIRLILIIATGISGYLLVQGLTNGVFRAEMYFGGFLLIYLIIPSLIALSIIMSIHFARKREIWKSFKYEIITVFLSISVSVFILLASY